MIRKHANTATSVAPLVGLSISLLVLVQYALPPSIGGCPIDGGCHAVRVCAVGGMDSTIWPLLGILGFLLALVLSLSARAWARRALLVVATLGGLIGASLLVLQGSVCGAFCPYCLVADAAGIALAACAWLGRREPPGITRGRRWAFGVAALAMIGGAVGWLVRESDASAQPTQVAQLPEAIAREQRADVVTVVEFMDFACHDCRRQHPEIRAAMEPFGGRVRLVRMYPSALTKNSPNAMRAAHCAEAQGKLEPMVDALLEAKDRSPEGCEAIATSVGLDLDAYRACVEAPETTARMQAEKAAGLAAKLLFLPTLFVGHERFDGNVSAPVLRASIERALATLDARRAAGASNGGSTR